MRTLVRASISFLALCTMSRIAAMAQSSPEFSLALSPAVVTVPQGAVTSFNLTLESSENPPYSVTLSGLPDGVQARTPTVRGGTGIVVLLAGPEAAVGTYAVQVTARTGKSSQTQILTLNVRPMLPVPQWEYTLITANADTDFIAQANSLGNQGWELVSVRFQEVTAPAFVGFFKRIKR